jgi:membrane-bound lytic murein transglycosylase A
VRRSASPVVSVFVRSFAVLAMALAVAGCRPKKPPAPAAEPAPVQFAHELPANELALRKIPVAEYPDFTPTGQTDPQGVIRAIDQSLAYLKAPSSRGHFPYLDITHERAVATLTLLREVYTREVLHDPTAGPVGSGLNAAIRENFEVYKSVGGWDPASGQFVGRVLFTGYFTPIYDASLTRGGRFQFPLYKRPADLATDPVTETSGLRDPATGAIAPHLSRAEIERDGKLAGQEYVWLADRFDAYVVTVQGSAVLRLADGRQLEVGYAGNNGHPYVSPGRQMVADGVIPEGQLSLKAMREYFNAHPHKMDDYLWLNPRTAFFTERPGGPFGSLNVKVTPLATLATDKSVYPRAMPAFLTLPLATSATSAPTPFRGFMLDQDTGGAIRTAARIDVFWGAGAEAAETAGRMKHPGDLYFLLIRE